MPLSTGVWVTVMACLLVSVRPGELDHRRREVDAHPRLVADHPTVVSRGGGVSGCGGECDLGAVVLTDPDPPRDRVAVVLHLAAVGAGDGLDALRPPPARLHRR